MKLSTRSRYGSRAMAELASAYPKPAVSVKELAQRQHLSIKYLEHLMAPLKAAELVKAVRGLHGGYVLARPPANINLGEVFRVLEGSPAPLDCVDHPEACPMRATCPTRDTWVEMKEALQEILESTTLEHLVERMRQKSLPPAHMYCI